MIFEYVIDPIARESRINNSERISRFTFEVSLNDFCDYAILADRNICQIVLNLFCGISVVLILMQLFIRIHTRRKLYFEDYVLLFGLTCLGVASYFGFTHSRPVVVHQATRIKPKHIATVDKLMNQQNSLKILDSFLALI